MDHHAKCPALVNPMENRCQCVLIRDIASSGFKVGVGAAVFCINTIPHAIIDGVEFVMVEELMAAIQVMGGINEDQ